MARTKKEAHKNRVRTTQQTDYVPQSRPILASRDYETNTKAEGIPQHHTSKINRAALFAYTHDCTSIDDIVEEQLCSREKKRLTFDWEARSVPERRELLDDVFLEASDHHLVLQQQVQLIRVLAAAQERYSVESSTLRHLSSPAPSCIRALCIYRVDTQQS